MLSCQTKPRSFVSRLGASGRIRAQPNTLVRSHNKARVTSKTVIYRVNAAVKRLETRCGSCVVVNTDLLLKLNEERNGSSGSPETFDSKHHNYHIGDGIKGIFILHHAREIPQSEQLCNYFSKSQSRSLPCVSRQLNARRLHCQNADTGITRLRVISCKSLRGGGERDLMSRYEKNDY